VHYIHITNNPVASNVTAYRKVKPVGYYHKLSATNGIYDRCTFEIVGTKHELEEMFENGLGRNVERFNIDGQELIFQGFIYEMVFNQPGIRSSKSLGNMYNRIKVRYTALNTGVNPPTETEDQVTATVNDTDSQDLFGIKTKVYRPPTEKMTSGMATQFGDTLLEQYKTPRRSDNAVSTDGQSSLKIYCRGYMDALDWRSYSQTASSGTQNANTVISAIIASVGQFIDSEILDTNSLQIQRYFNDDYTALQIIKMIAGLGDSSDDRWVAFVDNDRILKYQEASTSIAYIRRLADKHQWIKDNSGRIVQPWEIKPNKWLRTVDVEPFWVPISNDLIDDPQAMYIETVEWYEQGNRLVLTGSKGEQIQNIIAKNANQGELLL